MQRLTSRYTPEDKFIEEVEINKQEVFFCTRSLVYNLGFINNYTNAMVMNYGAIEFNTLEELETE